MRYGFRQAQQCLALFQELAAGKSEAIMALEDGFDSETRHGRSMGKYEAMLAAALRDISASFRKAELAALSHNKGALLTAKPAQPDPAGDFTLITWLIVAKARAGKRGD